MKVRYLLDGLGQQLAVKRSVDEKAPYDVVHPRAKAHPVCSGRTLFHLQLCVVLNDGRRKRVAKVHGIGELNARRFGAALARRFKPGSAGWYQTLGARQCLSRRSFNKRKFLNS